MSKLKQIIQLQSSNLSVRELARALAMSVGAVSKYLGMVRAAGISWEVAQDLDEAQLERRAGSRRSTARGSTGSSSATGT